MCAHIMYDCAVRNRPYIYDNAVRNRPYIYDNAVRISLHEGCRDYNIRANIECHRTDHQSQCSHL